MDIKIPKPYHWKTFELLCEALWEKNGNVDFIKQYGRQGQFQSGIDLYGYKVNGDLFAIQCKDVQNLTIPMIEKEINLVLQNNLNIRHYILCTTFNRSTNLQDYEILFNSNNQLKFEIIFWEDIEELLKKEENYNIFHRFYNQLISNNETLGHGVGKLINLELGFGSFIDTHFELMIGKIPEEPNGNYNNVNYYKGLYFIINFHEKRMDVFRVPCFQSDLIMAFTNCIDRQRITAWINSIENLDDFIYDNKDNFTHSIDRDSFSNIIKDCNNE
ncbi:MAG: hypothetical protein KA157_05520 [Aliarcobacter sp.]|nr:hypothetical protein [Aliarcobacter sp.]